MKSVIFIMSLLWTQYSLASESVPTIAIVVASNVQVERLKLNANNLRLIYLRKQLYWPNGQRIAPVNQEVTSPLRNQFSQVVLGSLPKQQIDYWNGMYFNGIQPPYSVSSDESVLRYVADNKGAIGYVDACHVDDRVQPIWWIVDGSLTNTLPNIQACKPNHGH